MGTLNEIERKFLTYKDVAIEGKLASLEISKNINYISRCSRDMMLGNDYENNLSKIKERILFIESYFIVLEKSIPYMQNGKDNQKLFIETKINTISFIYDVLSKMETINNYKNPNKLYSLYKKESTPIAVKSRMYFEKLKDNQNRSFEYFTSSFAKDIRNQRDIVFSSAILFAFLIITFILVVYKNVIKQIKTEETLNNTKNLFLQYKNAIDKTNIVSKTNTSGLITYVNDEFCKVSQYTKEELLGKPHNIVRHQNSKKSIFKELWETIKSKKSWNGIIENRKKDGSSYFVDTTIFPIFEKDGKVEEYIAIRKDITELVELNKELSSSREEILTRIGMIAETRSKETSNHVRRVAEYSKILAKGYGLKKAEIDILYNATALHDIGKVVTPDNILNKPGKLTFEEFEIMKKHTSDGYMMLKDTSNNIIKAGSIIAHEHHEKYDGSGYPRGIKGEAIHIYARITAIADVFDALGSTRVYKSGWELNDIVKFVNEQSGKHFDPELVKIFNDRFDDFMFIRKKFRTEY